ncbi:hypothetical protein AWJ20_1116 [Sugiyamaella lignohabitans]|uniref:Intradiol ring-cleavage dioxygenases domain-containing protein n=1 Tax=Sugiyamaella lignohabitans TaxID=796027 RepID=A0A167DF12_9ASCO|nr:uncharacterized protein AWJ20_1116 [Sugiyamaella lignohabitans]ANB12842.1 hypothetical protein AWJ20_1116 [Sugiyamaella lignohabitans]
MEQSFTDQSFTDLVIGAMGPKTTPKMRRILGSLIQHIHDFTRENHITVDEWLAGVEFINRIGQISDDKRDEGILVSDVFGLESLVDSLTNQIGGAAGQSTETAIIGPFYRSGSPRYPNGASIIQKDVGGELAWVHGRVTDKQGKPLAGVELEVWHTAPNGLYEQQDPDQPEYNLRGTFTTDENGKYDYICLRPTSYPIPYDGPAGDLLRLMDRHPNRPSHIHWRVTKQGYHSLITQIYDSRDDYVTNDAVFAVKDGLVVEFTDASDEAKKRNVQFELAYDITLSTSDEAAAALKRRDEILLKKEQELAKTGQVQTAYRNGSH